MLCAHAQVHHVSMGKQTRWLCLEDVSKHSFNSAIFVMTSMTLGEKYFVDS